MLLPFEKEILESSNLQASLTILARGLEYTKLVSKLLTLYSNPRCLVFVLNMNGYERASFTDAKLEMLFDVSKLTPGQRSKKYKSGGVFFGSQRVLVTDFINRNVEISKISALIVLNAENVVQDSALSFICYLFRENNALGLLKAFSTDAIQANAMSLGVLTRTLCLNKVALFPRFHDSVKQSLPDINVEQIYLKHNGCISEMMILIEDIIKKIYLNEKKEVGTFDYIRILLQRHTQRDISDFKKLISAIFTLDSLTIYILYRSMLIRQKKSEKNSMWILAESAHLLFDLCKKMLVKDIEKSNWTLENFVFDLENESFRLDHEANQHHPENSIKQSIEIFSSKTYTCDQRGDFSDTEDESEELSSTEDKQLNEIEDTNQYYFDKGTLNSAFVGDFLASPTLSGFYQTNPKFKKILEILDAHKGVRTAIIVQNSFIKGSILSMLRSLNKEKAVDVFSHFEFLYSETTKCRVIIAMCPSLTTVRRIEYISATERDIQVFILQYKNSLEEQLFLEEIREEKHAFEKIIHERTMLPLHLELERIEMNEDLDTKHHIVVDTREMRSSLSFFLYKAGNNLEIKTLSMGDYLLGANKCIERKSIDDLLGSLNSGRLYQQTQKLVHSYKTPTLLIEFPGKRPCLADFDEIENFRNSYIARFCLFLFNFPAVNLIWSDSHVNTVRIIRDMQKKIVQDEELISEFDPELIEILLCVPGINSFNVIRVCREFNNIYDLGTAELERLEKIFDSTNAQKVYSFFR